MTATNWLYQKSIEIIQKNQDKSGAYIASPNFEQYKYCWLRDGSFIAHAMDCVGEHHSSRTYFEWIDEVIKRYKYKIINLEEKLSQGVRPQDHEFLHTRYLLNGKENPEDNGWGNFQIDGYGSWLWAFAEHIKITQDQIFLNQVADSIALTVKYISKTFTLPCFDLWEENPEYLHTYSLSALYGGLNAIIKLSKEFSIAVNINMIKDTVSDIIHLILERGVIDNHFVKHLVVDGKNINTNPIDASLIAMSTPYQALPSSDRLFQNTFNLIENELKNESGGVYRYESDTYYGGGEWVLLAGWLGWHYAKTGNIEKANNIQLWIEDQADNHYYLPEQVSNRMLYPQKYQEWVDNWGEVAKPLLWSHAMYLILVSEIKKNQREHDQE